MQRISRTFLAVASDRSNGCDHTTSNPDMTSVFGIGDGEYFRSQVVLRSCLSPGLYQHANADQLFDVAFGRRESNPELLYQLGNSNE